jgi:hypothetical protein
LGIAIVLVNGFAETINVTSGNGVNYTIGGQNDPPIELQRGILYVINVTALGHPFYIKTVPNDTGTDNQYTTGVTNNGASNGPIYFNVPTNAPSQLYYHCSIHFDMGGEIDIIDPPAPPTVKIVYINIAGHVDIHSTGTNGNGWNIFPEYSCDLSGTNWTVVSPITNSFANGTNMTSFGLLDPICGPNVFLRVRNEKN